MNIFCENIAYGYGSNVVLENLNLAVLDQKITTLIGCNGSGKSTILKILSRMVKPKCGAVYLNGKNIHHTPSKEVAKILSILPQNPHAPDDITVEQLVSHGRFPNQSFLGRITKEDKESIQWSLNITGMSDFSKHFLNQLSGGQRQRAWIAMALAQGGDYLFLDEPTTYLDIHHQLEILFVLKKLNAEKKKTIVMVLHDINFAARFSDHIIAVDKGKIIKEGTPKDVLNKELLEMIFKVSSDIYMHEKEDYPIFIPKEILNV